GQTGGRSPRRRRWRRRTRPPQPSAPLSYVISASCLLLHDRCMIPCNTTGRLRELRGILLALAVMCALAVPTATAAGTTIVHSPCGDGNSEGCHVSNKGGGGRGGGGTPPPQPTFGWSSGN